LHTRVDVRDVVPVHRHTRRRVAGAADVGNVDRLDQTYFCRVGAIRIGIETDGSRHAGIGGRSRRHRGHVHVERSERHRHGLRKIELDCTRLATLLGDVREFVGE
jgi:hypothetical protein